MKIAVECNSILLQKALEKFLSKKLSSKKHCDIIIRDYKTNEKNCLYISKDETADLKKPFSKSQLFLALQNKYKELNKDNDTTKTKQNPNNQNFEILQKRIEMLTNEYQKNILEAIKAFYG
jgi:Tfp pilus assembly PilM family ATPase